MFNPGDKVWLVEGGKRREVTVTGEHGALVLVGRRTFEREGGVELTRRTNAPWGKLVKKVSELNGEI